MLIQIKQILKTTFTLLLFMSGGPYLFASHLFLNNNQNEIAGKPLTISGLNNQNLSVPGYCFSEDTIKPVINETEKKEVLQEDIFPIPEQLVNTHINFRINSYINYLEFNHFVRNESKKLFIQAWLKEKNLQRLSDQTDSLRNVYSNAAALQKEEISSQILKAEEKSITLNEEIPVIYQKVREEEDRYWQSASLDEIAKFQDEIRLFKDSVRQITSMQNEQTKTITPEIPDTITLYNLPAKTAEKKVTLNEGVIYKIQIGAYTGKIPESANKLIKKLSMIRKVDKHVDKGMTIFTTGTLRSYQEAVIMQSQVKQEGVKNAVITAYQNEKKITVSEARKLNNEL